jgi:hypothetical protein
MLLRVRIIRTPLFDKEVQMPLSGNQLDRESIEEATRRAQAEPLSFNPGERVTYVKSMIAVTEGYMQQGMSIDNIKTRLPEFVEDYKHLFEMITAPSGYDKKSLEIMMAMLGHMKTGKLSQHDASVIVGKRLYEKFGKPEGSS